MRLVILSICLSSLLSGETRVRVTDSQGREIQSATVELLSPSGAVLASAASGKAVTLPDAPAGSLIRVVAPGFADALVTPRPDVDIVMDPARVSNEVTVTATPGSAEELHSLPEWIVAGDGNGAKPTVAHALEGKPNVMLQQTGAGQVSPFLRGLTGYQVLNLVDGVRFNNSTFRSGPNQYLAYLEPSQASHVEAMLGPSGTQYGSDGLGGTIQVLTETPRFWSPGAWHGNASLFGQTADLSGGIRAAISRTAGKFWFLAGAAGQRHNDLRAGGGVDSHNVLTRFFGLTPTEAAAQLGHRQQDTAYGQAGAHGKVALRPDDRQSVTAWYQRGEVHGLRNTKDLWGGLGRLQSTLSPQVLDLFYVRYERREIPLFESISGRFSFNRQADGGIRQGLRVTDSVTREANTVRSAGYAGQGIATIASHTLLSAGGELYDEHVSALRQVNGAMARPLYPDGSVYRLTGAYLQGSTEFRRLRAGYGVRFSRVSYSNPAAPAWNTPASSQTFRDWTYQGSLLYKLSSSISLHALAGRGFRAPNLNDLGAIGLQDLGYEVPAREAIPAGALLADSSGEGAVSKGSNLSPLTIESLRSLETGVRLQTSRHRARIQLFDSLLLDPIVRRTLLFPAGAVPATIAGLSVSPIAQTAGQRAQNVVTVASAVDPRALKAFVNDGRARYWGVEADWEFRPSSRWIWSAGYSYLLGRDLDPNRNIRRLPPQQGQAALRYVRSRFWAEAECLAAGAQDRLSGGDRDDERIGASRRRLDIADFYNSARGMQVRGTELLASIQDRVLPGIADTVRVTLYNSTPGWAALALRAGFPLTETLSFETGVTNLADRNYRAHGSGIDAAGRSFHARLNWRF